MKVGFIGCGNMGGAFATAIGRNKNVSVLLADHDKTKIEALKRMIPEAITSDVKTIATTADFIFLCVKPHQILSVLCGIKMYLEANPKAILVSMAAGVSLATLAKEVSPKRGIIRIMPNTPAALGQGMTVYAKNENVSEAREGEFLAITIETGRVDALPEGMINAATAIMGCGPAFAYMFVEALADGGVAAGLPRDKATLYAAQMLRGAAEMVLVSGKHPEQLKDEVCSPGGSTIEGVGELDRRGFRGIARDAVTAAYEKNKKLG